MRAVDTRLVDARSVKIRAADARSVKIRAVDAKSVKIRAADARSVTIRAEDARFVVEAIYYYITAASTTVCLVKVTFTAYYYLRYHGV